MASYGSVVSGTFVFISTEAVDLGCDAYTETEINSWPLGAILLVDRGMHMLCIYLYLYNAILPVDRGV